MTIVLELKPEEETILSAQALAEGVDRETVLRRAIAAMRNSVRSTTAEDVESARKNQAAVALLDFWDFEDSHLTEEQRNDADADTEEFKRHVDLSRAEEGRPPAYS